MRFEFATATRILFGEGVVREVPAAAASMGRRVLLVTGASVDRAEGLRAEMDAVVFAVAGEPSVDLVRNGVEQARASGCDVVVAIGGGSAIDAGKAIAVLIANPGDPLDYLETVGKGQPLRQPSAPFIAVPTTAGTGSEVTRNAVLASPEHRVKASLRSPFMLPRLAVVDPELSAGLPRAITASTGLDALTQLIEPYVSVKANPMTDLYCVEGIRRVAASLPRLWVDSGDRARRADMAWASLLGGLALANAGLGAVHGFAAPVGGMFPAPHGAAVAAILPHATEVNVNGAQQRASGRVARYEVIARLLTGTSHASAMDGVKWISALCRRLEIPPLRTYGVAETDIPDLVEKAARANSMQSNPVVLSNEELRQIISRAL